MLNDMIGRVGYMEGLRGDAGALMAHLFGLGCEP